MKQPAARPRRVLFLFTQVYSKGGIQRFNQTMLDACTRLGINCHVLSLNDSQPSQAVGLKHPNLSVVGFSRSRRRFALGAAGEVLSGRYDYIVIGHINFLILADCALMLRPFRRINTLLIAHGIEVWNGIGWARRQSLGRVGRILCVSSYTCERVREQAPALKRERLLVFPNALADSWNNAAPASAARSEPTRFILSVTRLTRGDRYKGIASVIEAFSMLADSALRYFVVGGGDDLPFLKVIAARCGVQHRVDFIGSISDTELISLYRECEAFVLPSGKEGFGIVFLEAMFFGAPVIAAQEKGAIDVVQDGETGLLVPFGNTIAIKEAIERVLGDAQLRKRLCANGLAQVIENGPFTFKQFSQRCGSIFGV